MKNEIQELTQLGFKQQQTLQWGEGSIGINTVISFSHKETQTPLQRIPARVLSGVIPAIMLAESIEEKTQQTPNIRVFFPKHLAHAANNIPLETLNAHIQITKTLISALHTLCAPDIPLVFEIDEPITPAAQNTLQRIASIIRRVGEENIVESIKESALKHGNAQGHLHADIYTAHHPFGWQELADRNIFNEKLPEIVVNVLPPSEKRFLTMRRCVRQALQNATEWEKPHEIHDIEMNVAGAHYLLIDEAEPTLQDALSLPIGEVLKRFKELHKKTGNDNIRKAKNDFDSLVSFICSRTKRIKEDVLEKTLGELLEVCL